MPTACMRSLASSNVNHTSRPLNGTVSARPVTLVHRRPTAAHATAAGSAAIELLQQALAVEKQPSASSSCCGGDKAPSSASTAAPATASSGGCCGGSSAASSSSSTPAASASGGSCCGGGGGGGGGGGSGPESRQLMQMLSGMSDASESSVTREQMAYAFSAAPVGSQTQGPERILDVAAILRSCPDDLVFSEDDEDEGIMV